MRLGCCGTLEQAPALKAAGFDYLEVSVREVLRGEEPSATWDLAAPDPGRLALPVEAANNLVPPTLPIVGPGRNPTALQDYIQRVAKRAERLGIRIFVFGSGAARLRPEGVDEATAMAQIAEFARMAGEICAHHGLTLVVEHLQRGETNTINTLADELALIRKVNRPNVAALVDSYHYGLEHEKDEALLALGAVRHVHVAEPAGRIQPGGHSGAPGSAGDDRPETSGGSDKGFDFVHFFGLLKTMGYDGRVSFEGKWSPSFDAAAAGGVRYLRQAWERARVS